MEIRHAAAKTRLAASPEDSSDLPAAPEVSTIGLTHFHLGPVIAKGCNAVVCAAKWAAGSHLWNNVIPPSFVPDQVKDGNEEEASTSQTPSLAKDDPEHPLAIKMMFNYEAESNSFAIFNAMYRETVPAQSFQSLEGSWPQHILDGRISLPKHPYIVEMETAFADQVPDIPEAMDLFPDALPRRINPEGFGRNMSLFLIMKRYDCNLKTFLAANKDSISWKTSLTLLTQLLEGIAHMARYQISHRDLKTDNLLLDLSGGPDFPSLVITDFGCCLADARNGLRLPYNSYDINRGGNAALMAPEVSTARPGTFTSINYSKADVWAAGAIAYEIFGDENPFYSEQGRRGKAEGARKELVLPQDTPPVVNNLIEDLLRSNPNNRLSAELAATICQLLLWAPSAWTTPTPKPPPDTSEILQWLLTLTTKVLYESRFSNSGRALHEYQLVNTFLQRHSITLIKEAIKWISFNSK